ncbi:MAG: hypothetical protein NXI32_30945, partial [bacterium]|nr:hypothetical protein [bacterium]
MPPRRKEPALNGFSIVQALVAALSRVVWRPPESPSNAKANATSHPADGTYRYLPLAEWEV